MDYYVYLLIAKSTNSNISYVGYTNDLIKRLKKHNSSKGAKFTKGRKWKIIYSKKYPNKSMALKEEYNLKNDYKKREMIKDNYLKSK